MAAQFQKWLTMLVFVAVGLTIAAVVIPVILDSNRASRERMASMAIKTLSSAEAEFRSNDRDRNHVNDFWTGDVSGLYYVRPADGGAELRLIDVDVANADAKPIHPLPPGSGPRKRFRFHALDRDDSVEEERAIYRVDTDRSGRKVHNLEKFGFVAVPLDANAGGMLFVVNENNTVYRFLEAEDRVTWPCDEELKQRCCLCGDVDHLRGRRLCNHPEGHGPANK